MGTCTLLLASNIDMFCYDCLVVYEKQSTTSWLRSWLSGLPYLSTWITQQLKNFLEKLYKADGASHYKIDEKSINLRLKLRLPKDILLEATKDYSDLDPILDL